MSTKINVRGRMTNPPRPLGYEVLVHGRLVATLDHSEVKRACEQHEAMEKIWLNSDLNKPEN